MQEFYHEGSSMSILYNNQDDEDFTDIISEWEKIEKWNEKS